MKEITVEADVSKLPVVTEFVDALLEEKECPLKVQMQIDVAIDELFSNICYYAYDSSGDATVCVNIDGEPMTAEITFKDKGRPYDPLKKPDPDITLSAEERDIGGLGIFMVKKSMDEVLYEYKDGMNILTIRKAF
ncbi:MAG: ATP-binding protein [Lachnospiraceae bacterium]|nr:ATP-binding protein [Lachnospiraceae bacterium]